MIVNIHNSKDKDFEQELICASNFFAKELFSYHLRPYLTVDVRIKTTLKDQGSCLVSNYNKWGKPRTFEIELKRQKRCAMLQTLAHEFVHIKQFANCELKDDQTKWHKNKIQAEDISYYDLPWEIEASSLEYLLYAMHIENKKTSIYSK